MATVLRIFVGAEMTVTTRTSIYLQMVLNNVTAKITIAVYGQMTESDIVTTTVMAMAFSIRERSTIHALASGR